MIFSAPTREVGIAAVRSITSALTGQRTLLDGGIVASVVSLPPERTRNGCAYGIEFPIGNEARVRELLRAAGVSVSEYLREGGAP